MENGIEKVRSGGQLDAATPEELSDLTSSVIEAAGHTAKMTAEMVQLSSALDTLDEKVRTYNVVKGKTKSKMQSVLVNL